MVSRKAAMKVAMMAASLGWMVERKDNTMGSRETALVRMKVATGVKKVEWTAAAMVGLMGATNDWKSAVWTDGSTVAGRAEMTAGTSVATKAVHLVSQQAVQKAEVGMIVGK